MGKEHRPNYGRCFFVGQKEVTHHAIKTEHTMPASRLCGACTIRDQILRCPQADAPQEVRSAESRGYGRTWQKARKKYLEAHPLCVECMKEGRYVRATDVDHIKPHRGDRSLFWDRSNWQALCHRHHSIKTRREDNTPTYHY